MNAENSNRGGNRSGHSGGGYGGRGRSGGYGNRRGGGKSFGPRRDGGRGRGGFDRRDGGKRFHRDGEFHKDRDFRRDGDAPRRDGDRFENRHHEDGNRGGFRRDDRGGDRRDFRGNRGGKFRRDGDRRDFRRDDRGERRDFHKDGDRRFEGRRDDRRDNRRFDDRGGDRRRDDRRDFHKDFHKDGERRFEGNRGERDFDRKPRRSFGDKPRNPRYGHDDERDGRRFEGRRDDRRGGYRNNKYERDGQGSHSFYRDGRRNSDGTVSYPSQNPYTDRRPNEPKMPKGLEWSMLSKDEKERLRGLSKEHAENIGLHMLAAYALEEEHPDQALAHAKWIAKQASRIDMTREVLALIAYRQGDYKLALREFRTAYRMNGFLDYLPFIADCERGLGNPKKAVELAMSDEAKALRGEAKAEMFLVVAGAYGDLGNWDKAIELVHTIGRSKGISGEYRMRAVQAEQNFLEQAGRQDEALALDNLVDRLEDEYAEVDDEDDDSVIDNDLENIDDDLLEGLGIDLDVPDEDDDADADESDEDEGDGDDADEGSDAAGDAEEAESDETDLPAEETEDGADADEEPEATAEAADATGDADASDDAAAGTDGTDTDAADDHDKEDD
ncbi:helicase [Bifidobacterium sp. 82T24]|uniref:tetratricopeptide repeat protein n=1 Tax=Bifidobacterium pluvialisilvae TaxID=2834436 RepID=UPI001C584DBF|nr:helicase [Bifidobacterium pluvialisilvae]MBW3087257.1 helicase [Bifidobacterium pluvialisilvae]